MSRRAEKHLGRRDGAGVEELVRAPGARCRRTWSPWRRPAASRRWPRGSAGRRLAGGGGQSGPVRSFADALGKRAKTDPIDAAVIARFAAATNPEVRPLPDEETRLLPIWLPDGARSSR